MKITRFGLALVVLVAFGCGEEPTGPTTAELTEKREALKQRVAAAKKQGGKKPPKQAPKQPSKPLSTSNPAFGTVGEDYVYDPAGKRDPFRNFKWDRPDQTRDPELLGPLEQFDLSQLSLVGVVWKTGNARALVQDPSGTSYIVAEGARIGKNDGTIIAIEDNLVRVKETYVDFLGRETTKDIELRMRRNEGG